MRPQHITAENQPAFSSLHRVRFASMRPQHITAENDGVAAGGRADPGRFNEAAAYHCGKPRMARRRCVVDRRFNEAAAYHCGKRGSDGTRTHDPLLGFNEAAAYHCGKPGVAGASIPGIV